MSNVKSDSKSQTSMNAFLQTPKALSEQEFGKITQAIADMIVNDYVPLNIVEGEDFRNLM